MYYPGKEQTLQFMRKILYNIDLGKRKEQEKYENQ